MTTDDDGVRITNDPQFEIRDGIIDRRTGEEIGMTTSRIANTFRVPPWLITGEPPPSWLRHPIIRAKAVIWKYR